MQSPDEEVIENAADPLREELLDEIKSEMGSAIIGEHLDFGSNLGGDLTVRVQTQQWKRFADVMKHKLGFGFFDFLSCIDWMDSPYGRSLDSSVDIALGNTEVEDDSPTDLQTGVAGGETRFQVFARVYSLDQKVGVTVKCDLGDSLSIETWTEIYAGASWHEREAFEMFGINFIGHEKLRNIYLPTGFEGNPLRKDYPLLARLVKPWPGIVDVEPMPEVATSEAKTTPGGATTTNPGLEGSK